MAKWQRTGKQAGDKQAGYAAAADPNQPRVFTGQNRIPKAVLDEVLRRVAAPLGTSLDTEIVDPATGKFFKQPGISDPSGTDVNRP